MEQVRQHEHGRAWIGAALADALDAESPILRSFQAGNPPELNEIIDGFLTDQKQNRFANASQTTGGLGTVLSGGASLLGGAGGLLRGIGAVRKAGTLGLAATS